MARIPEVPEDDPREWRRGVAAAEAAELAEVDRSTDDEVIAWARSLVASRSGEQG